MFNPFASINFRPSRQEQRKLARTLLLGCVPNGLSIGALWWLWGHGWQWRVVVGATLVCALVGAFAWAIPFFARLLHAAWYSLIAFTECILVYVLMPILYLLVITPIGLILRSMGKLQFEKTPQPSNGSYWKVLPKEPKPLTRYFRQY